MSSRQQQKAEARAAREAREAELAAAERRKRRIWQLGSVLFLAAAVVVIAIVVSSSGSKTKRVDRATAAHAVNARFAGIPENGAIVGNPRAPVTMEEFADLQCPYCAEFADSALPTIVNRYVRTGKLRIVFRPLTFIGASSSRNDSERAARAALAAGQQGKLWSFVDLFYTEQKEENTGYVTDAYLRSIGGDVRSLDVSKMMTDRNSPSVTETLGAAATRANILGFTSTPSFTLGKTGSDLKPLNVNSLTADAFTGPIDQALQGK